MKLYCEDCKKIFQIPENAVESGKTECPVCRKEFELPQENVFPGMVIGDFLIESVLGKGGMGEIYLARQISLDRKVALKILQQKFTGDKEYVDGLFREARAAAKVNHPNIVQAYAVGEEDGVFYFAMELIRGETFKQIIQREKVIAPERALKVIREIASALDAAWREQRLVHQDIKPDNIMLDANGFAKLADLGLARKAGVNDVHAEAGDEVLGTPQYISPEQLTGVPTDVRSDIYSLGATFYQMVTGRYAYVADTVEEMSHKHVEGNLEPPNTVNPDVPEAVNAIIMKMMARNIEERYQEPKELIKDIDEALRGNTAPQKKALPSLKLKLKTPGAKKGLSVSPVPPSGAKKAAPVTPVAPVSPVPPSGAKKAAPVAPVSPVSPVPPSGAKMAAPETPVTPPSPVEAEKKEEPAVVPEKTSNEAGDDSQSVRSALIAKQSDAEAAEEEKEEVEELIASAPKKSRKALVITLISCAVVLILILSAAGVLCFCAEKEWMPPFAKPYAMSLNKAFKKLTDGSGEKSAETPKTAEQKVQKPEVPVKKAPETRKEFKDKVEKYLSAYRNDPQNKSGWHAMMLPELGYFSTPQTVEERRTAKPLLEIWHRVDELVVFAPYRDRVHAAHIEKLRQIEEKARLASEAEEKKRLEEARRIAEEKKRIELENQKLEQERKQSYAKLKSEINRLSTALVRGAVDIFRGRGVDNYNAALQLINDNPLNRGFTDEEDRAIKAYQSDIAAVKQCVADFQSFADKIADVSEKVVTIRMVNPEKRRREIVQMLGLSADGVLRYKPFNGKPAQVMLKNRSIDFSSLKKMKEFRDINFYVALIAEKPAQVLKKQTSAKHWKSVLEKFPQAF
ncbi:MAG: protein kinase [Lentisphaeria bacterium]|nr:protein kinase [Lentisphaeria bacterium]